MLLKTRLHLDNSELIKRAIDALWADDLDLEATNDPNSGWQAVLADPRKLPTLEGPWTPKTRVERKISEKVERGVVRVTLPSG